MLLKKVKKYEKEVSVLKELLRAQEVKLVDNASRIGQLEKDLETSTSQKKAMQHKLLEVSSKAKNAVPDLQAEINELKNEINHLDGALTQTQQN